MIEMMQWILSVWNAYWDEGFYQYLLLVSAVFLFLFYRKKESCRQALISLAAVLFLFFFPPAAYVIRACIGSTVYWRVLWLLPLIPAVSLAAAELVSGRKSKAVQLLLMLAIAAAVGLSGRDMLRSGNFVRLSNHQKVPDEAAYICNMISEAAASDGISEIRIASDDYLNSYIRVYDSSILMPFGRWGKGALDQASERLYQEMTSDWPNYRRLARLAKKKECNFLALPQREKDPDQALAKYGYEPIGTAGSYTVYQLTDDSLERSLNG